MPTLLSTSPFQAPEPQLKTRPSNFPFVCPAPVAPSGIGGRLRHSLTVAIVAMTPPRCTCSARRPCTPSLAHILWSPFQQKLTYWETHTHTKHMLSLRPSLSPCRH